jgi:hypothetical protein
MINGYNIEYTATCRECNSSNSFMKVLITKEDDEIENPSFGECLEYIEYGKLAICPICNTQGQFTISRIVFDDNEIKNGIKNIKKPYLTYVLKSDKTNDEFRAWIESGYFAIGHVIIAFRKIQNFIDTELWFEPLEGENNGSLELKVEFYRDPVETKVILDNNGYSQDEIIMVVKTLYDGIPSDQK